ncbi:MAG: aldo/keto reductase [Proteobacteria bacterium]|nr:aldo/keto reductase [Pseudomonadota bacterium]
MEDGFKQSILGKTGLKVGRLGLAGSYGAPAAAFEAAFEKGCNYFYSGSGRKRSGMKQAVKHLAAKGHRDQMVVSIQTYARLGLCTEIWFKQSLASMKIDHADILMLGWHNSPPSSRLMDFALGMKDKGLCRFIGLSGHNRSLFPELARKNRFDLFHIRYNPAHRGAKKECFSLFETKDAPGLVTYTATRWGHLLQAKHMPQGQSPLNARDCYRFSLSDPRVNICLCGPRDMDQMQAALSALDKGVLSPEETERITRIGDHVHRSAKGFFG